MNILSINIRGSRKHKKRRWIKELCFKHNVYFLNVQESKMTRLELYRLKSMWGNFSFDYACSMSRGRSGGIISMWDTSSFVKSNKCCDDNFIIVQGKWQNSNDTFFMIYVYGPQESSAKASLWNRLHEFISHNHGSYIICGDFNEVSFESDRCGSIFSQVDAQVFNSFIGNSGLTEIPMGGRLYTWMNEAGSKLSKLDRFLLSKDVVVNHPDLKAIVLDKLWSDHNPILFHIEKKQILVPSRSSFITLGFITTVSTTLFSQLMKTFITLPNKMLVEGEWITNPQSIKEEFFNFYKEKFKSFDSSFDNLSNQGFVSLCNEDVMMLQQKASLEEIRNAVWSCKNDKSPEPDGFSFLFIKTYWDFFKEDVVSFVNNFLDSKSMPRCTNSSFITLVPKIANPILIKDFRPISLIGLQYKIVAKLLANRLSSVIDKIVSPTQSAFISERQILDGPLMVSEIIDCPTPEFSLERGLRQGDPLSPLLFILVMEGLRLSLGKDFLTKRIKGVSVEKPCINLSHFFADDVIILSEWNVQDLHNITSTLNSFYQVSGLNINNSKSNLFGIGVTDDEHHEIAHVTGCQASFFPITYLGLPIGRGMNLVSSWNVLIEKFTKKLSKWKASLLSIGGQFTLIKSVLGSLGIYYFSLFKSPETVINTLEKYHARFFWGGASEKRKMVWVRWDQALASHEKGGLNIGSLKAFNLALLQKWSWRFTTNPNLLWVKLIKAIHGFEADFDDVLKCHPGNDNKIRFWKDHWIGDEPLCSKYYRLYSLDVNENCLLSERYFEVDLAPVIPSSSQDVWKWNLGSDGTFSVASTRTHIDLSLIPSSDISTTWIKDLTRKFKSSHRFRLGHPGSKLLLVLSIRSVNF
nr:RNA-directed DNA polymerase, eukaryota, reverse transcriptase zinc-binding domain protein [Tanacetum cinerariifolium]